MHITLVNYGTKPTDLRFYSAVFTTPEYQSNRFELKASANATGSQSILTIHCDDLESAKLLAEDLRIFAAGLKKQIASCESLRAFQAGAVKA